MSTLAPLRTGTWTVLPEQSTATFSARKLGVKTVHGTFPVVRAHVVVDATGEPTSVTAELSVAGIDTGHRRRDADLRKHFLAAAKHPTLLFHGTSVTADDGWTVTGTLRVKGVESPLALSIQLVDDGGGQARVVATGVVNRFAAGVTTAPRWFIAAEVPIRVEAVLHPGAAS